MYTQPQDWPGRTLPPRASDRLQIGGASSWGNHSPLGTLSTVVRKTPFSMGIFELVGGDSYSHLYHPEGRTCLKMRITHRKTEITDGVGRGNRGRKGRFLIIKSKALNPAMP